MRRLRGLGAWGLAGIGLIIASGARADVPFPTCAAAECSDPADFASYLFIAPGAFPNDYDPNADTKTTLANNYTLGGVIDWIWPDPK